MTKFLGKTVIVTGAGRGIGRASALAFAREGADVVVADLDRAGADAVAEIIGAKAISVAVDVADEQGCVAMARSAVERFGRLDVLFNNAGIAGARASCGDMAADNWRSVIDVNLNGAFYCIRAALPYMLAGDGGVIVNTASVDGLVGSSGVAAYVAAKHGIIGLTKSCALEYGRDKIRCVAIAPGFVKTDMIEQIMSPADFRQAEAMIPLQRLASAEEIAEMVVWLASAEASYVTGSVHQIDGGMIAGFSLPANPISSV